MAVCADGELHADVPYFKQLAVIGFFVALQHIRIYLEFQHQIPIRVTRGTQLNHSFGRKLLGCLLNIRFPVAICACWGFCNSLRPRPSMNGFLIFTVLIRMTINTFGSPVLDSFHVKTGKVPVINMAMSTVRFLAVLTHHHDVTVCKILFRVSFRGMAEIAVVKNPALFENRLIDGRHVCLMPCMATRAGNQRGIDSGGTVEAFFVTGVTIIADIRYILRIDSGLAVCWFSNIMLLVTTGTDRRIRIPTF
jgi:hypothetical protein